MVRPGLARLEKVIDLSIIKINELVWELSLRKKPNFEIRELKSKKMNVLLLHSDSFRLIHT